MKDWVGANVNAISKTDSVICTSCMRTAVHLMSLWMTALTLSVLLWLQNGCTPLHVTANNCNDTTADMLVRAGADVDASNKVGAVICHVSARVSSFRCTTSVPLNANSLFYIYFFLHRTAIRPSTVLSTMATRITWRRWFVRAPT
jgi:hypothetical protein